MINTQYLANKITLNQRTPKELFGMDERRYPSQPELTG